MSSLSRAARRQSNRKQRKQRAEVLGEALNRAQKHMQDIQGRLPVQTNREPTFEARLVNLVIATFDAFITESLPGDALGRVGLTDVVHEAFWRNFQELHDLLDQAVESEADSRAAQLVNPTESAHSAPTRPSSAAPPHVPESAAAAPTNGHIDELTLRLADAARLLGIDWPRYIEYSNDLCGTRLSHHAQKVRYRDVQTIALELEKVNHVRR